MKDAANTETNICIAFKDSQFEIEEGKMMRVMTLMTFKGVNYMQKPVL